MNVNIRLDVDIFKISSSKGTRHVPVQCPGFPENGRAVERNDVSGALAPVVAFGIVLSFTGNLHEKNMAPYK